MSKPSMLGHVASPSVVRLPVDRHFKAIVISDLHFPRADSHPKYLFECLSHYSCDLLVMLGDIREGYDARMQESQEMHLRVWDLIAARKAQGMRVMDIPGNHDSYKRCETVLEHKVFGTEYWPRFTLESALGKTFLFHGDDLDRQLVKRHDKLVYQAAQSLKICGRSLVDLHSSIEEIAHRLWGGKGKTRNSLPTRQQAAMLAADMGCQAVLMGHTHKPTEMSRVEGMQDMFYGNTGAWVGGLSTAMAQTHSGEWVLIDWREKREHFYAKKPQGLSTPNMYADFRDATLAECKWHEVQHALFAQETLVRGAQETLEELDSARKKTRRFIEQASEQLAAISEEAELIRKLGGIERLSPPGVKAARLPSPVCLP